jgi:hypothetical protein
MISEASGRVDASKRVSAPGGSDTLPQRWGLGSETISLVVPKTNLLDHSHHSVPRQACTSFARGPTRVFT